MREMKNMATPHTAEGKKMASIMDQRQNLGEGMLDALSAGFADPTTKLKKAHKLAQPSSFAVSDINCHKAKKANGMLCDAYGEDSGVCAGAQAQYKMECVEDDLGLGETVKEISKQSPGPPGPAGAPGTPGAPGAPGPAASPSPAIAADNTTDLTTTLTPRLTDCVKSFTDKKMQCMQRIKDRVEQYKQEVKDHEEKVDAWEAAHSDAFSGAITSAIAGASAPEKSLRSETMSEWL